MKLNRRMDENDEGVKSVKAIIKKEFLSLFLYEDEIHEDDTVDVDYECLSKFEVGDEVEILKEIEAGAFSADTKSYVIYHPKHHASATVAELFLKFI